MAQIRWIENNLGSFPGAFSFSVAYRMAGRSASEPRRIGVPFLGAPSTMVGQDDSAGLDLGSGNSVVSAVGLITCTSVVVQDRSRAMVFHAGSGVITGIEDHVSACGLPSPHSGMQVTYAIPSDEYVHTYFQDIDRLSTIFCGAPILVVSGVGGMFGVNEYGWMGC